MSVTALTDTGRRVQPERPADTLPGPELVARARDILAGRLRPPAMTTPDGVEVYLARLYATGVPPTESARRELTEELNLQAHYGGHVVVCARTADGHLAVLARGPAEMRAVLSGLTADERARVWNKHPEPTHPLQWPAAAD